MAHPAEEAKELIGQALGAVQDDPAAGSQLELLAKTLAGAQRHLFEAKNLGPTEAKSVTQMRGAMESLAQGLQILQDIQTGSDAVAIAAKSIAKSLAALYSATQDAPAPPDASPEPVTAHGPGAAPPPTLDDKRRKTIQLQLDSVLDYHGDTHFYTGLSGSIDEGGIFVATFDAKPINSKVAVKFTLPSGENVVTRGVVRWMREYNPDNPDVVPGMGVKFFELSRRDRKAIEKYIAQRAPLFYDDE